MQAYGVASEYGFVLPYSRKHESEADHIGVTYDSHTLEAVLTLAPSASPVPDGTYQFQVEGDDPGLNAESSGAINEITLVYRIGEASVTNSAHPEFRPVLAATNPVIDESQPERRDVIAADHTVVPGLGRT